MKEKNNTKKISYDNWKSSKEKWDKAVERTKNKESFLFFSGFDGLAIAQKCGYCLEFYDDDEHIGCGNCPLNKKGLCSMDSEEEDTVFCQYVKEMGKSIYEEEPVDWVMALALAEKIRDAIVADEPK